VFVENEIHLIKCRVFLLPRSYALLVYSLVREAIKSTSTICLIMLPTVAIVGEGLINILIHDGKQFVIFSKKLGN